MNGGDSQLALFVLVVVSVAVFLLFREFWCWYWKINRRIELLESIDESLKQLPAVREYDERGQRLRVS